MNILLLIHIASFQGFGQVEDANDFEVYMGSGVSGKVKEKTVLVGNKRLIHAFNVPISHMVDTFVSENETFERTCVLVSIEGITTSPATALEGNSAASGTAASAGNTGIHPCTVIMLVNCL